MKPVKILGYLAAGLLLGAIALGGAIALLFKPNEYKPEIEAAIEAATGRALTIEGDIGLSLFPWIGMELGPVTLANAEGFGPAPFARIEGAQVKLKLLPLLRREVEMKTIVLQGLRLDLAVAPDGTTNWDDLAASSEEPTPAAASEAPAAPQESGGEPALAALAIGGIEIGDAAITYDDRAAGARYRIEGFELSTGEVVLGQPVEVRMAGRFEASAPAIGGSFELKAVALADLESERYALRDLRLDLDLEGDDLPGSRTRAALEAQIEADLKRQSLSVDPLRLGAYGLELEGRVEASGILGQPRFIAQIESAPFEPRALLRALGQNLPEMADPGALGHGALALTVEGKGEEIEIAPLRLELDQSRLEGKVGLGAGGAITFDLALNAIDADRYLPPAAPEPESASAPAESGAEAPQEVPVELPLETLRALDIEGRLAIGELKVANLKMERVVLPVRARQGLITLRPEVALYGGHYRGNPGLDARGDRPRFTLDEKIEGVAVGPLLEDLLGEAPVSGRATASVKLESHGASDRQLLANAEGGGRFLFLDGAVEGINIAAMVRAAKARLKGEKAPEEAGPKKTDFSELKGSFTLSGGVVHNDDLDAKIPLIRVRGHGEADLLAERLDYFVNAKIVGTLKGQGGADLDKLRGLVVPVRIRGPFADPDIDLQYDELLKQKIAAGKARIKEKAGAALEEKRSQLKPKQEALERKLEEEREALRRKKEEELKKKLEGKLEGLLR